jgi:hypothetical protein
MNMRLHPGLALLALLVPQIGLAQETPEDLLSAGTQVYLRWDGIEAHRAAYEKTALGKMLQGDSGRFLSNLYTQLQDNVGALLLVDQLLQGFSPERLLKLQADAVEAPKLLGVIGQHGFILAVELRRLEPIDTQVTLILPEAASQAKSLFGTLRLVAGLSGTNVKEVKVDGQTVQQLDFPGVHITAWAAGKHLILTVSTDPAEAVVKRTLAADARLTSKPLFQRMRNFNQFETGARAFVDIAALVKLAQTRGPDVLKLLEDLGLSSVPAAVLYSGFDGDSERGLIEFETTGPRKGLLALMQGRPFQLSDLPALPQDVTSWSMSNFDLAALYDVGLQTAENIVRLVAPEDLAQVRELKKQADDLLGVELRNELLASLGNRFVMYSSPGDGVLNLGQTFLIQVKDAPKFQSALTRALKGVGRLTNLDVSIKKRPYHGTELREVHVRQQGFFFVPTYAIHKDWIVFSYFPQPVQGYLLRAAGELPAWKPDARSREVFAKLPAEMISVSWADPRPTIKQLLSLGPVVGGSVKSFFPDTKFEVGAVPNANEVARHLFPNIAVVSDKDNVIRKESRSSLELPIDLGGVDVFALFALAAYAGALF